MTTWTEHLAAQDREWAVIVRIEGVGMFLDNAQLTAAGNDGRYRFCVDTPAYAAGHAAGLWREYLASPLPEILAEEVDLFGGFPKLGTVTVHITDFDNFLTGLLRTEAPASTVMTSGSISASSVSFNVGSGAALTDDTVIYMGGEAMRLTNIAADTITVSRGYLGTDAKEHLQNDRVFEYIPNLLGRRMHVHVAPLQGESVSDERLVGEYVIDGYQWDRTLNTYVIHGRSQLKYLDRALPRKRRAAKIISLLEGNFIQVQSTEGEDINEWRHWTGSQVDSSSTPAHFFFKSGERIYAATRAYRTLARIARAGILGTPADPLKVGDEIVQVFVADTNDLASSFRYDPGASPTTDLTAADWVRTDNWVDIILCILTSPSSDYDGFVSGGNYNNTYGNWSVLPVGYGLGIPAALIDFASFIAVKNRTRDYRFPNFVYGDRKNGSAAKLISEHFLQVMGAYFSLESGLIKLILPKLPLLEETVTVVDTGGILAEEVEKNILEPNISVTINTELHASGITYLVGPEQAEISFTSGEFGDTYGQRGSYVSDDKNVTIPVPGGSSLLSTLYGDRAQARLFRLHKPNIELSGDVDASVAWPAVVGSLVSVTLGEMPDRVNGTRGWTSIVAEVIRREIRMDERLGVFGRLQMITYSQRARVGRICPSAIITAVVSNTATVRANRYTSSDATGGLPTADAQLFNNQDYVCRLVERNGTSASGDTEEVVSVSGNDITLSANFSGALAVGRILIFGNYDDVIAHQRDRYTFAADKNTQTVDSSSTAPYLFGEA